MMKAPLRPGTRPVGAATLAVEDTSTDGSVVAATPWVTARGPKLTYYHLHRATSAPKVPFAAHPLGGARERASRVLRATCGARAQSSLDSRDVGPPLGESSA